VKQIELVGTLIVAPLGEEGHDKQLIVNLPDNAEVLIYKMTGDIAEKISKRLRMSNKALLALMEEEHHRAEARAKLAGTVPPPSTPTGAATKLTDGIHIKEGG
jgi:hypothetical protein